MVIVRKIKDLWDSNEVQPIGSVTKKLVEMLISAREAGETIPLDLEIDILLAANYAFGYGEQVSESKRLLILLQKLSSESHTIDQLQIHRLACTVASSVLTQVVSDSQGNSNHVGEILKSINLPHTSLKNQLIAISELLLKFLKNDFVNIWSLELISFIITYRSIILILNEGKSPFKEIPPETQLKNLSKDYDQEIKNWKSHWLEKEDYFRFITLMILDKHAPEGLWRKQATLLTGLS